jgi:hypothetical protein
MRQFFNHIPAGNAINLPNSLPSGWTTSTTPVAGSFFVKHFTASDGVDYGHTGGVIEVYNNGTMKTVEQNAGADWSLDLGSVPHEYVRNQNYGFIYLIPEGVEMADKIDETLSKILSHGLIGRNGLRGRAYSLDGSAGTPWVGADLTAKLITDIFSSPEGVQFRDSNDANSINGINAQLDSIPALQNKVKELTDLLTKATNSAPKIADVVLAPTPAPVPPADVTTVHPTMTPVQPAKVGLIDRAINAIFKALHLS